MKARLESLVDVDPARAVREARALSSDASVRGVLLTGLKAAILVDAGSCDGDRAAVDEGVVLFRRLVKENPERADMHYNLGNGLVALADQEGYKDFDWYLTTAETRREARTCLRRAASLDDGRNVSSVALTNLGYQVDYHSLIIGKYSFTWLGCRTSFRA